jgi:hypothetical protein
MSPCSKALCALQAGEAEAEQDGTSRHAADLSRRWGETRKARWARGCARSGMASSASLGLSVGAGARPARSDRPIRPALPARLNPTEGRPS